MTALAMPNDALRLRSPRSDWCVTEPRVRTGEGLRPEPVAESAAKSSSALWVVLTKNAIVRLGQPVMLSIRKEDGLFFAENETLSIVGVGESRDAAVADFESHLLYFRDYYKSLSSDRITGRAVVLKQIFSDLFPED